MGLTLFRHRVGALPAPIASLLMATLLLIMSVPTAIAQNWEARLSDPIFMSWIRSEKIGECVECHLSPSIGSALRGKDKDPFGTFSRRSEMERWLSTDKHAIARRRVEPFAKNQAERQLEQLFAKMNAQRDSSIATLKDVGIAVDRSKTQLKEVPREWIGQSNVLSRRICDKLWGSGSVLTDAGYSQFRDACLTCHGGYQPGKTGFDLAGVKSADAESQLGIDCNYCHQIENQDAWVNAHRDVDKWRLLPPEQKADAGMRDLVDVSNQASLCMDCHVGNRSKNMFVTHEMYAAGHPPIPSIELQEFCEEMPQHWQTPDQLYESLAQYPGREAYFQVNYPGLADTVGVDQVFWKTRKMLIGALAARAKSLDLYIESAKLDPATGAHRWADYSLYDCAACHHELQSGSYRQQRYLNEVDSRAVDWVPGRPRQNEWPDALLQIAYVFNGKSSAPALRDYEGQLDSLFAAQPFGDPALVASAARTLREEIGIAIDNVRRRPVTANIARAVLRGLSTTPTTKMVTYDSARQVVWAMQTISTELTDEGSPLDVRTQRLIDRMGDPAVTGIQSEIPAGRGRFIYPASLAEDLDRRANFEPNKLKNLLQQVQQQLVASSEFRSPQTLARKRR